MVAKHSGSTKSESRIIIYDDIDVVAPWSDGPTETILFHHGVAMDRKMWSDWLPHLVHDYRVVTFDMYGCGESGPATEDGDWSPQARVRDVLALADTIGVETFHMVGESYGGTIALLTALMAPKRVLSLTVTNASHIGSSIRNVEWWQQIIDAEGMEGWAGRMMNDRFYPGALTSAKTDWYLQRQATSTRLSVLSILRELVKLDLSEEVKQIATPSLLLHGDSSPFVSVSMMEDLKRRMANAQLKVFPKARHGLPFSHGDECGRAVAEFLARRRLEQQS